MKTKKNKIIIQRTKDTNTIEDASDKAYKQALLVFGIDEDGHSSIYKDKFPRSETALNVIFKTFIKSGGMGGVGSSYLFEAWLER